MSLGENGQVAQNVLASLAWGAEPDRLAALFSVDARIEVGGDVDALPWVGMRTGRIAASDFIRDRHRRMQQVRFDVQDVLVSDRRAVIVGEREARVRATGRIVESTFALILTVFAGEITRFQMLEESFALSRSHGPDSGGDRTA